MSHPAGSARPRLNLYDADGQDRAVDAGDVDVATLHDDQLFWGLVQDIGCDDLPAGIRTIIQRSEPPVDAVVMHDGCINFTVPRALDNGAQLSFWIGTNWVVTCSAEPVPAFDAYLDNDRGETLKGRLSAATLAATLMLLHLEEYRAALAAIDQRIDALDEEVLRSARAGTRRRLMELAVLRRRVSRARVLLQQHRKVIHPLSREDFATQWDDGARAALRMVLDSFDQLGDEVARSRDLVVGAFELHATRTADETNRLIKVLTIITVITGTVGMVAGIFGMNVDLPIDLHAPGLFWWVIGGTLICTLLPLLYAMWRRWI